jgi:hypothetical protein
MNYMKDDPREDLTIPQHVICKNIFKKIDSKEIIL